MSPSSASPADMEPSQLPAGQSRTWGPRRLHALAAKLLQNALGARRRAAGQARSAGVTASMIALDEALSRLAAMNPRHAQVVKLRFLGGLSGAQIAERLQISADTVERDWRMARAWLNRELARPGGAP